MSVHHGSHDSLRVPDRSRSRDTSVEPTVLLPWIELLVDDVATGLAVGGVGVVV
jgi:hypothetical protein